MLPLRLTTREFAAVIRLSEKTVLRKIAARQIEAKGRPFLIPRRELAKFGVDFSEVTPADYQGAMEKYASPSA